MRLKNADPRLKRKMKPRHWFAAGLAVLSVTAIFAIHESWKDNFDASLNTVRNFTVSVATAFSENDIMRLVSADASMHSEEYAQVYMSLQQLENSSTPVGAAYILIQKEGAVYYAVDSQAEGEEGYVPPGEKYPVGAEVARQVFGDGLTVIDKSAQDQPGKWIRVLVPLKNMHTGKVFAAFGIDFPASENTKAAVRNTWNTAMIFIVLFFIMVGFYLLSRKYYLLIKEKNDLGRLKNTLDRAQEIGRMGNWEIVSGSGRFWASKETIRIYGMEEIAKDSYLEATDCSQCLAPEDRERVWNALTEAMKNGTVYDEHYSLCRYNDGARRFVHSNGVVEEENGVRKMVGVLTDITELKQNEQKIIENELFFRTLFEQSPIGMNFGNDKGEILDVNNAFAKMAGRSREELMHASWADITHPDDLEKDIDEYNRMVSGETDGYEITKRYIKPDGSVIWAFITVAVLKIPGRPEMNHICIVQDISDQIIAEGALKRSERSNFLLLSNLHGMVYRSAFDREWTMYFVSDGCFELTGYPADKLLGNREFSFNDLIAPQFREPIWRKWCDVLETKGVFREEYPILTASGELKWVFEQGEGVYDEKGQVEALEGLIIDISDRKQREDEILYLNHHDVLTGLYNRIAYKAEKQKMDREGNLPISVVVGDINGLKLINGALGYSEGDRLIARIAQIVRSCAGVDDVVARMGGGEFSVLLPRTDDHAAASFVENVQAVLEAELKKASYMANYMSFSLGYAVKRSADENIDDITKMAEEYMYRHKLLEQKSSHSAIISSIKTTMLERSQDTEEHAERLLYFAKRMGEVMHLTQMEMDELELLATLHDIGKVGIDDNILNKNGMLTDDEWVQMKKHPEIGYRIALASPQLVSIAEYILTHHERWDGKGYPFGLMEKNIPILSRIISVVDAFDAMTQDRPYRKKMPREDAIAEIERNKGTQFDPEIAELFISIAE